MCIRDSPYTYNHSHNVASTTVTLAGLLGCSRQRIFLLYIAGLLHDLGKMTISEMILDKPGPLSKEEMSVMKQHTYYTYWWLKGAFNNSPIAEWAASVSYTHLDVYKRQAYSPRSFGGK